MASLDIGLSSLVLLTPVLLSVSGVLWTAVRWRSFGSPPWGIVPLARLAAVRLFEVGAIVPSLGTPVALLLRLVLGLPLVKRSNLSAGPFALSGTTLFTDWHIEATVCSWDSPIPGAIAKFAEPAFFLAFRPIWVLRTCSLYE